MNRHRRRARGADSDIAMEVVGARLCPISSALIGGSSIDSKDVFSLVWMRNEDSSVFEKDLVSWRLWNDFISDAESKEVHCYGNLHPSFQATFTLLEESSQNSAVVFPRMVGQAILQNLDLRVGREVLDNILTEVSTSLSFLAERLAFAPFGLGQLVAQYSVSRSIIHFAKM